MTDTHLAALARRAAADPGDLELAVALRAAQERAGVAPPVRLIKLRSPRVVHIVVPEAGRIHGTACRRYATRNGYVPPAPAPWTDDHFMACSRCRRSRVGRVAAGLAGTPRDRVLLERQALELARRVGVVPGR